MIIAAQWETLLVTLGVKQSTAKRWALPFEDEVQPGRFNLGAEELDDFLSQVLHESNRLESMQENLNYSAERMVEIWPGRFPTMAAAAPYARNPEALANKVYAGRMGNIEPDDGYRFRGRGPIQLTGRDNYEFVGNLIGQDLTVLPELMEQPRYALEATIAWWEDRIPDSRIGDPERVRRLVNGGIIGLDDTKRLAKMAREALQ